MLVFGVCRCPRAPEAQKEGQVDGDLDACAGCSRNCAGNATGGWPGATCWLSAERTRLGGEAWAVLCGAVHVSWSKWMGTCDRKVEAKSVLRGAASSAPSPSAKCPAPHRRDPCRLTAIVVAVAGGRARPPLRCQPRGNSGLGLEYQKHKCTKMKGIR